MGKLNNDIKRYKQITGSSVFKEPSIVLIILFRVAQRINKIWYPLKLICNIFIIPIYKFYSIFLGISIPRRCKIGQGLIIFHYGAIALNPLVEIGDNCTIRQGVTIGNRRTNIDVPKIGNNVDIGAGAVIIGDIKIGNNVGIGANAVVLKDVPDDSIAVGNPAKNLPRK